MDAVNCVDLTTFLGEQRREKMDPGGERDGVRWRRRTVSCPLNDIPRTTLHPPKTREGGGGSTHSNVCTESATTGILLTRWTDLNSGADRGAGVGFSNGE